MHRFKHCARSPIHDPGCEPGFEIPEPSSTKLKPPNLGDRICLPGTRSPSGSVPLISCGTTNFVVQSNTQDCESGMEELPEAGNFQPVKSAVQYYSRNTRKRAEGRSWKGCANCDMSISSKFKIQSWQVERFILALNARLHPSAVCPSFSALFRCSYAAHLLPVFFSESTLFWVSCSFQIQRLWHMGICSL